MVAEWREGPELSGRASDLMEKVPSSVPRIDIVFFCFFKDQMTGDGNGICPKLWRAVAGERRHFWSGIK